MNEPAKWKRPRKARWIVLGVLGGIVLFAVGVFLEAWISAGSLLKRERESIARRAAELGGKPIRHVAIIGPGTPGESWKEFERVRTELNSLSTTDLEAFPTLSGDEFPTIDDTAMAMVIQKMGPALEALDLALRQEGTETGIELGDALPQDHLATMIQLGRMLTDSAASRHRQGDGAEALRHLGRAFALPRLTGTRAALVDHLIAFVVNGIQFPTAKAMLASYDLPAPALAEFARVLDRVEELRPDLIQAVRWEDMNLRKVILDAERDGKRDALSTGRREKTHRKHLPLRIYAAQCLQWQEIVLRAHERIATLEPWEQRRVAQEAIDRLKRAPVFIRDSSSPLRAWRSECMDRVQMNLLRVSVAIARYEAEFGAFPPKLDDLAPYLAKIPRDLWNGVDFRYQNNGTHATVYALGGDGRDDGGLAMEDDSDPDKHGDMVWTIKRKR